MTSKRSPLTAARAGLRLFAVLVVAAAAFALAVPSSGAAGSTWVKEAPPSKPPGRAYAAMAYDPINNQVVLFGGLAGSTVFGDTWVWDGSTWSDKTPKSPDSSPPPPSPPPRGYAAMAFDPASGKVILFGGYDQSPGVSRRYGDTWAWDGRNSTWSRLFDSTDGLSARTNAVMAADRNNHVVLFGGATTVPQNDTWIWANGAWSKPAVPGQPPPGQESKAGMAFDPADGNTVLFASKAAETWAWDGLTWTKKGPMQSPPGRDSPVVAYDARSDGVVLFGGSGFSADGCGGEPGQEQHLGCPLNDTWLWKGGDWALQGSAGADAPGSTVSGAMAENPVPQNPGPADRSIVYFGGLGAGFVDETWTWDSGIRAVPVIGGISPNFGSTTGGTAVTISGSQLSGVTKVQFGADPAAALVCPGPACTIVDDATIVVTSPAHAPAIVDIVASTPFGAFSAATVVDRFTYVAPIPPPPVVTAISPTSGPTAGGQPVAISGANLVGATAVRFGPDPAAAVACPSSACSVASTNLINVTTPAQPAGGVHVVVDSPDGSSALSNADIYNFTAPVVVTPAVTGVDPPTGSTDGGEPVVVRGSGLAGATKVRFGPAEDGAAVDCPSISCTIAGDGEVDVVTPAHPAATVHVTVLTADRSSVATDADQFTFAPSSAGAGFQDSGQAGLAQPLGQTPFQAAPPGGSPVGAPPGVLVSPGIAVGATPGGSLSASPVNAPNPGATPPPAAHPVPGAPAGGSYAPAPIAGDPGRAAGTEGAPYYPMVRHDDNTLPLALEGFAIAGFACFSVAMARRQKPKPRPAYRGAY